MLIYAACIFPPQPLPMVSISHPSMAPSTQEKSGDPSESEPLGAAESMGGMETAKVGKIVVL